MSTEHDALRDRAFELFGHAVLRSDPGRLEAWVELGLTLTQLRVLFLVRADNGASAGALADGLRVTPSTVTRIVDRLVRQRLVLREPDEGDRRMVRHYLSSDGARALEEIVRSGRARMSEVMDRLSPPQLERLIAALEDLTAVLEAQEAEELTRVEA